MVRRSKEWYTDVGGRHIVHGGKTCKGTGVNEGSDGDIRGGGG